MRAGTQTLIMLSAPRIALILQALAEGKKAQLELRREVGLPSQSTLRGHLGSLEKLGAVARQRQQSPPGAHRYELRDAGRELLEVAACVEAWLAEAPDGPLELGADSARAAIKGLAEGWSATVLPALAADPLSLTELDKRISVLSYPSIERCLQTMRLAAQLEVGERRGAGIPYTLTDWMRRGLTPLGIAARWESRHRPQGADAVGRSEISDAVQVGRPLLKLDGVAGGVCQLAVRVPGRSSRSRALAFAEIEDGKLAFGSTQPQAKPDAWASGTAENWFATVIDADTTGLRLRGDTELIGTIIDGVRAALFTDVAGR